MTRPSDHCALSATTFAVGFHSVKTWRATLFQYARTRGCALFCRIRVKIAASLFYRLQAGSTVAVALLWHSCNLTPEAVHTTEMLD